MSQTLQEKIQSFLIATETSIYAEFIRDLNIHADNKDTNSLINTIKHPEKYNLSEKLSRDCKCLANYFLLKSYPFEFIYKLLSRTLNIYLYDHTGFFYWGYNDGPRDMNNYLDQSFLEFLVNPELNLNYNDAEKMAIINYVVLYANNIDKNKSLIKVLLKSNELSDESIPYEYDYKSDTPHSSMNATKKIILQLPKYYDIIKTLINDTIKDKINNTFIIETFISLVKEKKYIGANWLFNNYQFIRQNNIFLLIVDLLIEKYEVPEGPDGIDETLLLHKTPLFSLLKL